MAGSSSMGDLLPVSPEPRDKTFCAEPNPVINESNVAHQKKKSNISLSVPFKSKKQIIV